MAKDKPSLRLDAATVQSILDAVTHDTKAPAPEVVWNPTRKLDAPVRDVPATMTGGMPAKLALVYRDVASYSARASADTEALRGLRDVVAIEVEHDPIPPVAPVSMLFAFVS